MSPEPDRPAPGRRRERLLALAAVALPLAVYLAVLARGYDGKPFLRGDCPYYYRTAVSLLRDGDLDLANQLPGGPAAHAGYISLDRRGRPVPKYPILMSIVSAPLIALFGPAGALGFNLAQIVVLLALLFVLARQVSSPGAAALAVAATGILTMLPHYAWNYSPDVFAAVPLTGSLALISAARSPTGRRRVVLAGLGLGLAVVSKFPLLLAIPGALLLLPSPRRALLPRFAAGLAVPLAVFACLNLYLFGAPWTTSYDRIARLEAGRLVPYSQRQDFDMPLAAGSAGQLFDPRNGLLPTSALTVLSFLGLPALFRRRPALAAAVGLTSAALFLFFSTYQHWARSHHGNRFLLVVVALAALPLAAGLDRGLPRVAALRAWRPGRDELILALLAVVALAPVWSAPHLPTQDGAAHLENAAIFRDYYRSDRPWLRDYYMIPHEWIPVRGGHLALAGLGAVFPPLAAEKIFSSGYLLLFLAAARYLGLSLSPAAGTVALLAFPLAYNALFHLGSLSFCYSLALLLFGLGFWWRRRGQVSGWLAAQLAAGSVLLWLADPISAVVAVTSLGGIGAGLVFTEPASRRAGVRSWWRYLGFPVASQTPALLLLAVLAGHQREEGTAWPPRVEPWKGLLTLDGVVSFTHGEIFLTLPLALLLLGATGVLLVRKLRRRHWQPTDSWLLAPLAPLVLYFVAPDSLAGTSWVSGRLDLAFFLLMLPWLAVELSGSWARRGVIAVALVLGLGLQTMFAVRYAAIERTLAEYLALGARVPPASTLLPVALSPWGADAAGPALSSKVRPLLNAAAYLAVERGNEIVLLDNDQAGKSDSPVRYRPGRDPTRHLAPDGGFRAIPPRLSLAAYERATGRAADYVLLWGFQGPAREQAESRALLSQIESDYERIATSEPTGRGELYRRRPTSRR